MSDRLIDLVRRQGEVNLGQTLVRLAAMAQSMHLEHLQRQLAARAKAESGVKGLAPGCALGSQEDTQESMDRLRPTRKEVGA